LLIANGVFAMSEAAIISARKARLQQLADEGSVNANVALSLANNPNQFLASVQIGITLVGILAGAFGGATIAGKLEESLRLIPILAPYAGTIGVGIVVLIITYFSLVIGELIPKRLALNSPERIASAVALPMQGLATLATPVVRLLDASTEMGIRLLGIKQTTEPTISPEEIRILVAQGRASGVFEETEQEMIESILRLDERRVSAFMTPRMQIVCFDLEDSREDIRRKMITSHYSRFPLVEDNLDNVLGIIHTKDILFQNLADQPLDLKALARPTLFVPENISALKVLELLKQAGAHTALVIDEYGGILGMVTHNDILEEIVGYVPSASEPAKPGATRRRDGSWLLDGLLSIDELKEIFNLEKLPDEEYAGYQTVGGFMITQIGNIPTVGQSFDWENLRFEVVDMDGRRVDKVLVAPLLAVLPAVSEKEKRGDVDSPAV